MSENWLHLFSRKTKSNISSIESLILEPRLIHVLSSWFHFVASLASARIQFHKIPRLRGMLFRICLQNNEKIGLRRNVASLREVRLVGLDEMEKCYMHGRQSLVESISKRSIPCRLII